MMSGHNTADTATALGLLGGTFDPIHYGHLRLAEEARMHFGLERIRLIPAGQPPHRALPGTSPAQRLQMVELAAAGNPALEVDAAEVLSAEASYTVLTLERLRRQFGSTRPLLLILGADAFADLDRWHRWEEILPLCHLAIATRPGYPCQGNGLPAALRPALAELASSRLCHQPTAVHQQGSGLILPFPLTALDISATRIRSLITAGSSVRYLLPDSVVDYIGAQQLYRAAGPQSAPAMPPIPQSAQPYCP
ncbi:MAG: nicotinate-nucleotide adenylyltransferase [Thauera sp.]|jgi:nicotinate-nucleotide adenylyltransferase|nr:nicotinate-nucleotide adenylyltransferase [Thauera sp.]